jgi:hypothetical protein
VDPTGVVCMCAWGWYVSISHTPSVSLPRGEGGIEPVEDEALTCNVSLGMPSGVNTMSLSMTFALRLCVGQVERAECAISTRSPLPFSLYTSPNTKSAHLALEAAVGRRAACVLGPCICPFHVIRVSRPLKTNARWHTSRRQTPASYTMRTKGTARRSKETRCCRGRSRPTAGAVF